MARNRYGFAPARSDPEALLLDLSVTETAEDYLTGLRNQNSALDRLRQALAVEERALSRDTCVQTR